MPDELHGIDPSIPNKVIIDPRPTDYVSGDGNIDAAVANRILVPSGDWTPYVVDGERQSGNGFDSDDCTAFSYTNAVECQFKYYRLNGKIPQSTINFLSQNGYLDANGDLNCSDRALGSMAGTTDQGNSLNKVADTAYKMGLVPESKWPSVFTNYAEYYKPVPAELQSLAQQFLQYFDLPYESTSGDLTGALQACPLYVALCTCGGWNNPEPPPIAWCNAGSATNHAVCLLKQNNYRIFDSYDPFVKDFAPDYYIPYFYKVLLTPKGQLTMQLVNDKGTVYVVTGNKDKRKIGIADLTSLGLFGDEPQTQMDTSSIPEYNIIVSGTTITHKK
jgi:hypothetical protein